MPSPIQIRSLHESELGEADRIFRTAFGTFLGLPEPTSFAGDTDYVRTRWRADREASFAAVRDGVLLGSNFASRWGSFGFFGPISVRPDLWDQGVARLLLDATMRRFESWGVTHTGLFTFANSPKHVGLYQRYGFAPRFLTAIMDTRVAQRSAGDAPALFSALPSDRRAACLAACADLTGNLLPGLDLASEIAAVQEQAIGDTVLLRDGATITGFAVCHVGAGSEAGSGTCYVKFGAVRPGADAHASFARLLDTVERFAAWRGVAAVIAGVNTARQAAYRAMLDRGFRIALLGIAMQRPNEPGFNRADVFAIDDWR